MHPKINLTHDQIEIFVFSWFFCDLITAIIIKISHKIGALDKPHDYKAHAAPTPFFGGVAVYLGFMLALFTLLRVFDFQHLEKAYIMASGGFIVLLIGCFDDFISINAVLKLIFLFVVVFMLSKFNIEISLTNWDFINILLTLFWIVGVISAFNSLDNTDGVAAGVGAIAAFWTYLIAWYSPKFGQPAVTYLSAAILGSLLGFLRYNFMPAKIFLGNNGAFVVGFILATLMVLTGWSQKDPIKSIVVPCAILAVPLYDITLSTILRIRRKVVKSVVEAIVYCGKDHITHRLIALGFSKFQTVIAIYLCSGLCGAIGAFIQLEDITKEIYLPIVFVSFILMVVVGRILDKADVYKN